MLQKLLPYLVYVIYTLFKWTWRVEVFESESLKSYMKENKSFVVAHWHHDELGVLQLLPKYHVACMISLSKDGALMAKVVELMGAKVARGSSSRGAIQALKGVLRLAREGRRPSIAVDGPRGPIYKVKPGVVEIARVIKAPIFCISMCSSNSFISRKSWNKLELPLPFSRMVLRWGDAIHYTPERSMDEHCMQIENELNRLRQECFDDLDKRMDY
ncbi:MAG: lysophospholipid acyltransferase family protein [Bdellovibrionaceae bacterium]|nr:lysophospholipid acyltransferase family protein [Pseudobdellovibrionaceae bacterium]